MTLGKLATPWRWQDFGRGPTLVTEHSGARVVLMGGTGHLKVADETGRLVPLTVDHPVAQHLLTACNQHQQLKDALRELLAQVDARSGGRIQGDTPMVKAATVARELLGQK